MADIWDEVEEVQEVQNTPKQQPTNDIWGEVEEVSTQPNLRLTGEVKKYNESANPVRNAIRQIGRNTARFILPKKAENWFLGSKEDEEFLKKYNDDNVMSYEDAATLYKQGLLSKDEFMKNTGLRLKLDSLKADAEYKDVRNTNIGKGVVDIGTAVIPFGGGGKVATTVAGKLTPYLGKKIATEAAKGAIIGGKAGLAHGVGYGLVDEDINPLTQGLVEGGIGLVGGGLLGAGAGKLERTLRAKDIAKRRATPIAERMTEVKPQVNQEVVEQPIQQVDELAESVPQQTEQPKINLNTLKSNIRANKFEQGNLNDYMVVGKGKKGYKSTIADPISYDIEKSQRDFNKIITEISKNPEKLNDEAYLDDLQNRVQQIIDRTPYGETEEVSMPYWEKFIKAVDDGYNYNEFKLNRGNKPQQLEQVVPQTPDGYKRLYRGLTQEYDPKYDRAKLDNVNNYESWTDNYDLAEAYGDNVYYIDVPENSIAKDIIDENPKSMTYGDRNLLYENDKPVGIKNKSGKEYLLYTGHEEYPNIKYNKINKPQQLDEVIPEQVAEDTVEMVSGETKTRSLPQSVLEAKGTPKEVKEIIKQDKPTYQVMHNQDLIKQATDEIAGNFDNELIRLSSAKDFDALDYEKSRQIAKNLFGMGKYQQAVDLIDNVSENATKKGQAIQALSLWSNMTPEGAVYKAQKLVREYNKKHPKKQIQLTDENIETIANLQQEALNTTDELAKNQALARTAKYTADLIPKEALQKLKAYRNIAMLLNPKTLGRNIVGNVAFNTIDTGSKGLASLIDRGLSKFTGQRTRVAPQLGDYFKGGLQGAKTGYQEALQGIDTRGLGQRFDLSSGRTFQSKPMKALETALDVGLRVPDRAFYEATFAESVQNMMKAQGLTEPTQEILEQAEREALESVFQDKTKLSDFALGLRGGINRIGTKDFGLGDVLIPYAQTPANLTQQAINYSPLKPIGLTSGALAKGVGSGLKSAWDDRVLGFIPNFKSGVKGGIESLQDSAINYFKDNQRQASLDLARSLIGTGLIGGGYGLAKAGLTTPSQFNENYTKNKKIRENLQPLGIRPDQIGDMWYAPFQPMSSPIATGTAMAYGENPLYAGLNTVVDQPYLQGVTRGLRDLQEGDWTKAATNVVASIPSQFVPTFASQLAQSIDPYQRETYDPNKLQYGLNTAIAKIPFASKTLPEKIDVTGQPIERYSTKGGQKLFDIFLNPTFINKKTTDPVLSELKYIYDQTKETSHFMPSVDKKLEFTDVDGNLQNIVLTGREFSEYQRILGQRMYDEFNYVMDLPEYANADEYGKIEILKKAKTLVKAEVDNEMWNKRNRNKKRSYTGGN